MCEEGDGAALSAIDRIRMLGSSESTYYAMVSSILRETAVRQKQAENAREEVLVPMVLPLAEKVRLERMFSCRIKLRDYGIRSKLPIDLAGLVYMMDMRNSMMMGSDGEEAIYIDGDLPSLVAKGLSYGHICRTHATARLEVDYHLQQKHLDSLSKFSNSRVSVTAATVLRDLQDVSGARVCENAASCKRMADTIFINHAMTPVSLEQAVLTARAHQATVVRGVCFFQPEMLVHDQGELHAFKGSFIVDRQADVISFVPRSDPTMAISHPYSSLMSFFTNNEYVDGNEAWLVEKHMSGDGIFYYIVKKQLVQAEFPDILSTNYYTEDMTRFIYLTYSTYFNEKTGVVGRFPLKVTAPVLESVYEKVMPALLSIDAKRLTFDEVLAMLKNHNNMVFAQGDVVKKAERVWYSSLKKAAVPMLAMALVRRSEASASLRLMLDNVKVRTGLVNKSALALAWVGIQSSVAALSRMAFSEVAEDDVVSALGVTVRDHALDIKVERGVDYVTVAHVSGKKAADYGRVESWLPGKPVKRFDILARARAFVFNAGVSVSSSMSSASIPGNSEFESTPRAATFGPVPITEQEIDVTPVFDKLGPGREKLFEKLVAQHDANSLVRPPRTIRTFEGVTRPDVEVTPMVLTDPVVAAQDDYDRIYPGVSLQDAEAKPVMAAEADLVKHVDMHAAINDSKRLLPPSKVIRRSRLRTAAGGKLPRCQASLMAAVMKRNVGTPSNRGFVNLEKIASKVVDKVIDVCFIEDWQGKIKLELESGLWQVNCEDLQEYVPKVPTSQMTRMMKEMFDTSDENLTQWLLLLKNLAKPPMDAAADAKVPIAQSIMYSEQKTVNAKYSSMQTRVYHAVKSVMRPNISLNNRDSPEEHEIWFNSCEGVRSSADHVYAYEGDITCYDRSQELVLQAFEFAFYRRLGINEDTLAKWSETHGVKRAVSMMFGLVFYIFGQGLSGIWKTLFRNGICCLGAVLYSFDLQSEDIITLDVVGDDFLVESNRSLSVAHAIDHFVLTFNLTAKLFGVDILYMCSKYWVKVGKWWYYVQDPVRKVEGISRAIDVATLAETGMHERWISLRDDLRHYDNALVMYALAEFVKVRMGLRFQPLRLIQALATLAESEQEFKNLYGPEEYLG